MTGGQPPVFVSGTAQKMLRAHNVSDHTLQAFANHAEPREPLVLLVIADPWGHWYKGDTAA